jgi:hypothetical protein
VHWFLNLKQAQEVIENWRMEYNKVRPHSSMEDKTPCEFVKEHQNMLQEQRLNLNLVHISGKGQYEGKLSRTVLRGEWG